MSKKFSQNQLIEASLSLIETRGWAGFSLAFLAEALSCSVEELQTHLPSKKAFIPLWHAHLSEIIKEELPQEDLLELSPKDRLLELFMLRFERMTPHKQALKALFYGLLKDPCGYQDQHIHLTDTWKDLLTFAHLPTDSLINRLRLQAVAGLYTLTLQQWLEGKFTEGSLQAFLDQKLTWGERVMSAYQ